MRIFVAGSTGVIGRFLLPKLVRAGHEVTGMTRSSEQKQVIQALGARAIVADVFDSEGLIETIGEIRPDVVIHQLTSLSNWSLADNARIRMEGTRNLVDAAQKAGVKKMIAQSIAWAYESGDEPATEEVPLDIQAPLPRKTTIDGIVALEGAVAEVPNHVILRYGTLYGPDTWYDRKGAMAEKTRNRELPATEGTVSFLHVEDAAHAAFLALDWPTGTLNIVDDEPAPGTNWLPVYADALQAPMPEIQLGRTGWERGASNAKARNEYGWEPIYPTWSSGFAQALR
ncbi:dTDP-glucose 4,6-dehydratase [Brevibacillus reuszeri]|uniref:dTDP-glucose 4,6-dehydratase n=1 Tax=Brevibacillus reuszeri TaxID=54915 RepID=A0A0K9YNN9_9BACL|nr:NAD(P)-dependent oxidoreductase [Brevibacillus reuszeri]KNB70291.1 dTDP-glucose 4,6-dehydratase [Brevibacillus reuszeri]MED1859253.1 NAD(P)-dependent oxidoreductase [Brevibacillus reuszeri]GED72251.1 dTDP-glucose 4,6-dehydratase [Brevibacillus reuszeri]